MTGDTKPQICGLGQPMLDITATVGDGFLKRHGLRSNDSIMASQEHANIFQEIVDYFPVGIFPGGQTLNAIRCVKWMLGENSNCLFSGAIGKDAFGRILIQKCEEAQVETLFYVQQEEHTSTCAALINGNEGHRSMVASTSGANTYPMSYLMQDETWERVTQSQVFYTESYLLTAPDGPSCLEEVAKEALAENKIFSINLSAPFIQEFFRKEFLYIMRYVDMVFGNEHEAAAFAEFTGMDINSSVEDIAKEMAALPSLKDKDRVVIITQGADPTIVCIGQDVTLYEVPYVSNVVDTTGAGDAFVGGYMSQLLLGRPVHECVRAGHYAASVVIQHLGAIFPIKNCYQSITLS